MTGDTRKATSTLRVGLRFEGCSELVIHLRPDITPTVNSLIAKLPLSSVSHRWGDEVYFDVPFHSPTEKDARSEMALGEVAYWPDGDAIAVFFGPTPVSRGGEPRAYSPCNILGGVEGELESLKGIGSGARVTMRVL